MQLFYLLEIKKTRLIKNQILNDIDLTGNEIKELGEGVSDST